MDVIDSVLNVVILLQAFYIMAREQIRGNQIIHVCHFRKYS